MKELLNTPIAVYIALGGILLMMVGVIIYIIIQNKKYANEKQEMLNYLHGDIANRIKKLKTVEDCDNLLKDIKKYKKEHNPQTHEMQLYYLQYIYAVEGVKFYFEHNKTE